MLQELLRQFLGPISSVTQLKGLQNVASFLGGLEAAQDRLRQLNQRANSQGNSQEIQNGVRLQRETLVELDALLADGFEDLAKCADGALLRSRVPSISPELATKAAAFRAGEGTKVSSTTLPHLAGPASGRLQHEGWPLRSFTQQGATTRQLLINYLGLPARRRKHQAQAFSGGESAAVGPSNMPRCQAKRSPPQLCGHRGPGIAIWLPPSNLALPYITACRRAQPLLTRSPGPSKLCMLWRVAMGHAGHGPVQLFLHLWCPQLPTPGFAPPPENCGRLRRCGRSHPLRLLLLHDEPQLCT